MNKSPENSRETNVNNEFFNVLDMCRLLDVTSVTLQELADKGIVKAQTHEGALRGISSESALLLADELDRYQAEGGPGKNKTWLTFDQAATALEMSTEQLNKLRQSGVLPGYFDKTQILFKNSDLRRVCLQKWADEVRVSVDSVIQ